MGPRKRVKPNPLETPAAEVPLPKETEASEDLKRPSEPLQVPEDAKVEDGNVTELVTQGADRPRSTKSWYGGTWPRIPKAAPVTQVARESISAASGAASALASSARSRRLPSGPVRTSSLYLTHSMGNSSRSMPIAATTTKLNITSTATAQPGDSAEVGPAPQAEPILGNAGDSNGTAGLSNDAKSGAEKLEPEQTAQSTGDVEQTASQHPNTIASTSYKPNNESASWLAWFSKTNAGQSVDQNSSQPKDAEDSTHASADGPSQQEDHEAAPQQAQRRQSDPYPLANSNVPMITPKPSSWFGLWNNAAVVAEKGEPSTSLDSNKPSSAVPTSEETTPKQTETPGEVSGAEIPKTATIASSATKSSGWAFWSRDTTRTGEMPKSPKEDTGELAVADTPSQSSPTIATAEGAAKLGTQERPKSLGVTGGTVSSREPGKKSSTPSGSAASRVKLTELVASKQLQKVLPNLVLPTFESTYRPQEHATLLQQLGRFLQYNKSPVTRHVSIARDKPRIKKALAIGVHGYFPVPLIRSVLGQPTGTSIRFASSAASAIKKWTESHGYACEIEKIALEGEGKVAERVELLWKLLLNWIEEIRKADFVMIACHSQGVPVAMMLVARLIAFGCVNGARVGVCAMAGVNLGPFSEYKSRWISGSAGELFDFSRPDSKVSKDYLAALQTALQFGVRIVYIGSIDDQLVSLESSTYGTISHPYVYRAVFVDGRVHAPGFLAHLVGFALKLRNLGISDHGLIRELSSPLAGSLYGGEGHSRIYEDESVYHLAVVHALETTSVSDTPLQVHPSTMASAQNPYILPFAMRGLLEEDYVRTELYNETNQLLRQFDDWNPSSKVLRDVKFRLEGVRSKL